MAELATPEYCLDTVEMLLKDLKVAKADMSKEDILAQVTTINRHILIAGALLEDGETL